MGYLSDLNDLSDRIHDNSKKHGFWEDDLTEEQWGAIKLALVHSEVSEALEALREGNIRVESKSGGKPEGLGSELADIIIRVLDLAAYFDLNIQQLVLTKMHYNETRPYKHGKSF